MVQIPINARVRALEAGVPQQAERLAGHMDGKGAGGPQPLAGEQAPLLTRVEALERAMASLLKAQVTDPAFPTTFHDPGCRQCPHGRSNRCRCLRAARWQLLGA